MFKHSQDHQIVIHEYGNSNQIVCVQTWKWNSSRQPLSAQSRNVKKSFENTRARRGSLLISDFIVLDSAE